MSKIELEDIKKVLPNMNFLVLAIEDVDLSGVPEENMGKRTQVFSASTFKTKSDFLQAAIMLATDEELREIFSLILELSKDILNNPNIQEHLKNIVAEKQNS